MGWGTALKPRKTLWPSFSFEQHLRRASSDPPWLGGCVGEQVEQGSEASQALPRLALFPWLRNLAGAGDYEAFYYYYY